MSRLSSELTSVLAQQEEANFYGQRLADSTAEFERLRSLLTSRRESITERPLPSND